MPQHAITIAVAAAVAGTGLAGGGHSPVAFSTAALVLWGAVLVAVAAGLLPRAEPPHGAIAAGACLIGIVALIAVSLAWASDDGGAFEDLVRAFAYLGLFVLVVVASRRGGALVWLRGLAIGLVVICFLALGSRLEPGLFGNSDLEISAVLPAAEGRLSYPIGYWNGLAAAMASASILLAWLGARASTRGGRALAVALFPLPILTIYAATSRGGFAVAAIGLVVLVVAMRQRPALIASLVLGGAGALALVLLARMREALLDDPASPLAESQGDEMAALIVLVVCVLGVVRYALDGPIRRMRVPRLLVIVSLGAAIGAAGAGLAAVDLGERWEEFKEPPPAGKARGSSELDLTRGTSSGRYQFWSTALEAFEEQPLRGIGSGGYETYWNQNGTLAVTVNEAHSLFLESAAELGIGGLGLTLGFFGVAGFCGIRRRGLLGGPGNGELAAALGVLAASFAGAAVDWTWELPAVLGPGIVAAALLCGPATLPSLAPRVAPPMAFMRSRRRFAGGVSLLLVAWAAICASGLLLLAERALDDASDAYSHGDFEEAISQATEATQLQPWAAAPHQFLANTYRRAGDLPSAQAAVAEAIERSPEQWRYWLLASQLDIEANDLAGARVNFRRAYELLPNFKGNSARNFRELVERTE